MKFSSLISKITFFMVLGLFGVGTLSAVGLPKPATLTPTEVQYRVANSSSLELIAPSTQAELLEVVSSKEFKENLNWRQRLALKLLVKKMEKADSREQTHGKSQIVAALLCFFLGGLGVHRFYLGYTGIGVIQFFTAGGFGIWWLIDFIRILVGDLQPKHGPYESM